MVAPPTPSRQCPRCGAPVDPLRSRHVDVDGGSQIRAFCSDRCFAERDLPLPRPSEPPDPRPRRWWRRVVPALVAASGCLLVLAELIPARRPITAAVPSRALHLATARAATSAAPAPAAPDPAMLAALDAEAQRLRWTAALADDHWVHPLAGPKRRMPIRGTRIFGAARGGNRPLECMGGHCGVDIGGEVWGEPVLAAHDGVVDRVQRDPDHGHGGLYVRLAHREGTVFTQYFHLAAIPRRIRPGLPVSAGDVIGLLGDTGVKDSAAHLHFTVSVKQSPTDPEQYIDPEPLIALWAVAVPVFGDVGSIAYTHVIPGHPLGPHAARRSRRRAAKQETPSPSSAPEASGDSEPVVEPAGGE